MPILVETQSNVVSHWHSVAAALGAVLPGDSRDYRADFEYRSAVLVSASFPQEVALRTGGRRVPVVPLLPVVGTEHVFWVGWYEEWRPAERVRGRKLEFCSSALTVYRGHREADKRQLIRAEWAGADRVDGDVEVFPADGAAHPHWHFDEMSGADVEELATRTRPQEDIAEFGVINLEADETVDSGFRQVQNFMPSGIHYAISARWAQEEWPGPEGPHSTHAAGPIDIISIRRWLTSCVRYLQVQIQTESLRRRK